MKTKKYLFTFGLFLGIAIFLKYMFFKSLNSSEFLFMGDQFYRFTLYETLVNSYFIRKPENLNVFNAWQQITQFWDILYYLIVYKLHISFITAEKILFFIILFFSQVFAFLGFQKIQKIFFKNKYSHVNTVLITIWYIFNPYTLELWHGGVYNIGSGITYSLLPLLFAFFYESIFYKTNIKKILITALLFFISTFTFWLIAVTVFFLGLYTILYCLYSRPSFKLVSKNIFLLTLFLIPLILPVAYTILHEMFNNAGDNNATFSPTYGNQKGGLWYQFLMLFSWGIYNVWHPRTMYSFHTFFFSKTYIFSIIALYGLIILGVGLSIYKKILKKNTQFLFIFLIIFGIAVFLAKGAQEPFGEIFEFMYNNVPLFSVFRTPDIRFGFMMVISLSILLIFINKIYNRFIFFGVLMIIILIQNTYFINGLAIKGEEIPEKFYDRVLYVPKDYKELASFLNTTSSIDQYILPIPADEYGAYHIDDKLFHIGPDIVSKFIHHPFIYLSTSTGIYTDTYNILKFLIDNQQYEGLSQFPIQYILIRNDLNCYNCTIDKKQLETYFTKTFSNKTFELYEAKQYKPLIDSPNSTYLTINPVTFEASIDNLSSMQKLQLSLSHNTNWKLFLQKYNGSHERSTISDLNIKDLYFLFKKPFAEKTHTKFNNYGNEWTIDKKNIVEHYPADFYKQNEDGSISVLFRILYIPQLYYMSLFIVSVLCSLGYVLYIIRTDKK